MIPIVIFPSIIPTSGDGLADSYFSLSRYIGSTSASIEGTVEVGVNDIDTVRLLDQSADITEGSVLSVHGDDGANYQNNSGFDAMAVLTLIALSSGTATRHVKIFSHSVADTAAGTLVWEMGQQDNVFFDAANDLFTTPPLRIQTGHFINIQNVDDARAGTNNVNIDAQSVVTTSVVRNIVVERGA